MRLAFDTFARVIRHFREFGASGHCLVATHTLRNIAQDLKHHLRISEKYDLRQPVAFIFSNRTIHQRLTALPQ